jgi:hypothetical protein
MKAFRRGQLRLFKEDVQKQDLSIINGYYPNHRPFWNSTSGEHYKLLAWLSYQLSEATIIDAGTFEGLSALAFALNPANTIYTYDVVGPEKVNPIVLQDFPNIHPVTLDITQESDFLLASADIICLDIDPHDGLQEQTVLEKLRRSKYTRFMSDPTEGTAPSQTT